MTMFDQITRLVYFAPVVCFTPLSRIGNNVMIMSYIRYWSHQKHARLRPHSGPARGAESGLESVAQKHGNRPRVRVRVRVDQATSTLTSDHLLQFDPIRAGKKGEIFQNITAF